MPCLDALGNRCTHKVRLHFRSIGTPEVGEFTALQKRAAGVRPLRDLYRIRFGSEFAA